MSCFYVKDMQIWEKISWGDLGKGFSIYYIMRFINYKNAIYCGLGGARQP